MKMQKEIQFQVECLTRDLIILLMEDFGWDMTRAMDELYHSETFERLQEEKTGLYYQSPVYVFDCLKEELKTGIVA